MWGFFELSAEDLICYFFLVRGSVPDTHHSVSHVGLPSSRDLQALHWLSSVHSQSSMYPHCSLTERVTPSFAVPACPSWRACIHPWQLSSPVSCPTTSLWSQRDCTKTSNSSSLLPVQHAIANRHCGEAPSYAGFPEKVWELPPSCCPAGTYVFTGICLTWAPLSPGWLSMRSLLLPLHILFTSKQKLHFLKINFPFNMWYLIR